VPGIPSGNGRIQPDGNIPVTDIFVFLDIKVIK